MHCILPYEPVPDVGNYNMLSHYRDSIWCYRENGFEIGTRVEALHYTSCFPKSTNILFHFQKSETPLGNRKVVVTWICLDDGKAKLLLYTDKIEIAPAELLILAMPVETPDIKLLAVYGPVWVKITNRNADILILFFSVSKWTNDKLFQEHYIEFLIMLNEIILFRSIIYMLRWCISVYLSVIWQFIN